MDTDIDELFWKYIININENVGIEMKAQELIHDLFS